LLGVIMHEREILRLEHMSDDPRSSGFPANHPPMDRLLGVPVQTGTQLFGMLYLTDRLDDQPFTQEDEWLVESLAGYAALAIAGTQLSEQRGRLTLLEERERVGMELHDGIIQSLYAIGMQLQLLQLTQPSVSEDVGKATRSLDMVIEDIRRYIMNLRVANYEQKTLYEGLKDVIARLHIPSDLTIELKALDRQPPFAPPVMEAVCQIAHEAVSNIVRHADATRATIEVTESPKQFQMVIEDNGRGFDPNAPQEGLGLRNIMQRARIHNGELIIEPASIKGTRLTLKIAL
jgi:signal transduction histidine kinase